MNKRIIALLATIIIILGNLTISSGNVEAATKATNAKKAYAQYLTRHPKAKIDDKDFYNAGFSLEDKSYVSCFSIYDIDNDKVPELIATTNVNFRWFIVRIYTYKNGKVVPYKFADGRNVVFHDSATANGAYSFYICEKGHIHNDYKGYFGCEFKTYKVSGKKLKLISKKEYSHASKNIKGYENNATNRKKLKNNKIK